MQFRVPVFYQVDATNASAAEAKIKKQLGRKNNITIGSAMSVVGKKPPLSEELARFMAAEIQANDDDKDGYTTDLDYVKGTPHQMPGDVVREQAAYTGPLDEKDFVAKLKAEFDALYEQFGGGSIVCDLLPEEASAE